MNTNQGLVEAVKRYSDQHEGVNPLATSIEGLTILRSDHESRPQHLIFKPALCIILQGAKRTMFGGHSHDYGVGRALVVTIKMPALSRIVQASPSEPYLGLIIEFDWAAMREVLQQLDEPPTPNAEEASGAFVIDFDGPLADCALRLVRLLETPKAVPMLHPSIVREICYWLLTGPHGGDIYKIALASGHAQEVMESIHLLRDRFAEPVRIKELAQVANMSPSAFHQRFKSLTGMTPLQYQKQMRLVEARRRMVTTEVNVETVASQVGYVSPSQFSREYSRMFGAPPRRDAAKELREGHPA